MFFSMARLSLTAAALVLPIYVQAVAFTVDSFKDIAVGKAKNLTWSGDGHPVTIKLMQGDPKDLETVVNVASNVEGDHYTWTPTTLAAGTYVLSITQGSETNYSPQFSLTNNPPSGDSPPPPMRAGTKPPTAATPALALPGTTHPATLTAPSPTTTATSSPPPKAAAVALALPPPGASLPPRLHVPSAAPIAADYYPPAVYKNENSNSTVCEFNNDDDDDDDSYGGDGVRCVTTVETSVGHLQDLNPAAGAGVRRGGAGVLGLVGVGFAVMLVL